MKQGYSWYSLILMLIAVMASHYGHASVQIDGVAAIVNGNAITISEVISGSRELQQAVAAGRPDANQLYREVLERAIERKLILDAYENQSVLQIPEAMIDQRVQEVIHEMFSSDRNAFLEALGEDAMSEVAWRTQIREQMMIRAMRDLRVDRLVQVSPTEVRLRYEATIDRFMTPERVRYSMILLSQVESQEALDGQSTTLGMVIGKLAEGHPFEEVARLYSEGREAAQGGQRDWVQVSDLREELRTAIAELQPGEVSELIDLGSHYAIIQLDEREPMEQIPFADAYDAVEQELYREKADALYATWVERLREQAFVRIVIEAPF